ncbi:MAG: NAD(P)/FAD-dependent oxidoreductase [Anaerolineaceae bacterium]|nr:MAG: NAD(P)/FAD-dependent oxidoreductase [Anaerolineaceae bacterium]
MKVAVVGGGMMGVSLGYFLAQEGVAVEIYEASSDLGGLAGQVLLEDGTSVDRFFHAILSSDAYLRQLCDELNLTSHLQLKEKRMGIYHQGEIHPVNGIFDFLRFPTLRSIDRLRLCLAVLCTQYLRAWRRLEGVNAEEWLVKLCGERVFKSIWRPMLRSKYGEVFDDVPATQIWASTKSMRSICAGFAQKQLVGHLIGGHLALINALAKNIEKMGGKIHLGRPVQEIMIEDGRAWGLRFGNKAIPYEAVIATVPAPLYRQLIPDAPPTYHGFLDRIEYMGIIVPLLVLDRPISGYWRLNIADERFSYTSLIETTTFIDPQFLGGHHLVYLPKYTMPDSWWQQLSDDEIQTIWLYEFETMFPAFDQSWIRQFLVHREPYFEPVHRLDGTDHIPSIKTPVENLYLATTAQFYPKLNNCESVSKHARHVAQIVLDEQCHCYRQQNGQTPQVVDNERVVV